MLGLLEAGVPWSEKSMMSQRHEFVMLFAQQAVNRRELCRRFGIGRVFAYRRVALQGRSDGHRPYGS
jgi:hypothetical protein